MFEWWKRRLTEYDKAQCKSIADRGWYGTQLFALIYFCVFAILLVALVQLALTAAQNIYSQKCVVDLEGAAAGRFVAGTAVAFPDATSFPWQYEITSANGKVHIEAPCYILSKLR